MPHFETKEGEPFPWEAFQKHMGFSDEELKAWMEDPIKNYSIQSMCSPGTQKKWMVVEVIKSHGCANGLQPGDKLYFKGLGNLDPERSSHWCGHNLMYIPVFQDTAHNMLMQGKDPNDLYPDTFSCVDTTCKYGWGYVENRCYVVDEDDLPPLERKAK